jgi:hypothetical protein
MKHFFIFWIGGTASLLVMYNIWFASKPPIHTIKYNHPQIKSPEDIYQIPISESVSDVCFDGRLKKIVVIEGAMILQQCELDSNR